MPLTKYECCVPSVPPVALPATLKKWKWQKEKWIAWYQLPVVETHQTHAHDTQLHGQINKKKRKERTMKIWRRKWKKKHHIATMWWFACACDFHSLFWRITIFCFHKTDYRLQKQSISSNETTQKLWLLFVQNYCYFLGRSCHYCVRMHTIPGSNSHDVYAKSVEMLQLQTKKQQQTMILW